MFQYSRFKYMVIYAIHEAIRLRGLWVEWLYYVGGRMWWVDSMVFGWEVHDHNARS